MESIQKWFQLDPKVLKTTFKVQIGNARVWIKFLVMWMMELLDPNGIPFI